jgi:F-type H+-transporting ATPase subunit delta
MAGARGSARRYAEAAFQIAERDGTIAQWLEELDAASRALSDEGAARVLANPAVPGPQRAELAERILADGISQGPRNLVLLLLRRGRVESLPDVAREFRRLYDRREGIVEARVTSAAPLDDAETEALRGRLSAMTGGRIQMTFEVDPAILGGVVVRLGDRLIDGSVRGRLERLRSRLAAGTLQAG